MVPFKPYFVGDETPPYPRAASIQKCVRAGGKHNDLDDVGRTNRALHVLRDAGQLQLRRLLQGRGDPVGVGARHRGARARPRPALGHRPRHRRRGRGDLARRRRAPGGAHPAPRRGQLLAHGRHRPVRSDLRDLLGPRPELRPDGGPGTGHEDRYVEIWNLVFMQYDQRADGTLVPLPEPSIDTGAGLERNLAVLQGVESVWDIDVFRPLIDAAEQRHRRGLRRFPAPEPTCRCASSPSTRARWPSSSATAWCRRTRSAATCCAASSGAPSATRTCSARANS